MGAKGGWSTTACFASRQPLTAASSGTLSTQASRPQPFWDNGRGVVHPAVSVRNATILLASVPWHMSSNQCCPQTSAHRLGFYPDDQEDRPPYVCLGTRDHVFSQAPAHIAISALSATILTGPGTARIQRSPGHHLPTHPQVGLQCLDRRALFTGRTLVSCTTVMYFHCHTMLFCCVSLWICI